MNRQWQDEENSSSSSSSEDDAVLGRKEESQRVNTEHVPENDKNIVSHNQNQALSQQEETIGISRRWIYDRVHGTVQNEHGHLVPKPPCFLCWPPPILKLCPRLLEENLCCVTFGKLGFCSGSSRIIRRDYYNWFGSRGRGAIMTYALLLNVCGLLVTIFAALAMAETRVDLVRIASFATANLQPTVVDGTLNDVMESRQEQTIFPFVSLHLGLQAVLIQEETVVQYDEFCSTPGMEQFLPARNCNLCDDTSVYVIFGIVIAMVAYVPTLATDSLRIYQDYDVNCQKVVASLWSLVSLAGYGLTYYYYNYVCLASFYTGNILYDATGNVAGVGTNITEGVVLVNFDWKIGKGQICLLTGFGLKCIDFLCNCCLATPSITRDHNEQWVYERFCQSAEVDNQPQLESNIEVRE